MKAYYFNDDSVSYSSYTEMHNSDTGLEWSAGGPRFRTRSELRLSLPTRSPLSPLPFCLLGRPDHLRAILQEQGWDHCLAREDGRRLRRESEDVLQRAPPRRRRNSIYTRRQWLLWCKECYRWLDQDQVGKGRFDNSSCRYCRTSIPRQNKRWTYVNLDSF